MNLIIDNERHENANDKLSLRQVWQISNLIGWEMFVLHVRHARCTDVWSVPASAKKKHGDNYHIFVSTTTWEFLYLLWWCSFQFRVVIRFANFVRWKQGGIFPKWLQWSIFKWRLPWRCCCDVMDFSFWRQIFSYLSVWTSTPVLTSFI